jgi:hypothetical protein
MARKRNGRTEQLDELIAADDGRQRRRFYVPATREVGEEAIEQEELLADLAAFELFREEIAPAVRAMIDAKTPAKEMYAQFESVLAARALSIALTARDPGKAFAAVKDILDRQLGKATENRVVEHKLANLKDDQLDALLESKLREAGQIEVLDDEGDGEGEGGP